ncbi:MAG TPA: arginase family protein [Candidatus Polarisedimenticolia bacterium]|nr:arginase family protein [Candidatus Polarisedimenticolia bacterium]
MKPISIIEAPLAVGIGLAGTERMSRSLLDSGLASRLQADIAAGPGPADWPQTPDPETGVPNPKAVGDWLLKLGASVEREIGRGRFPVVLGGDCTVLLGSMLGAKRKGAAGLLFIDGHTDYTVPGVRQGAWDAETASMDLALVTGVGKPQNLARLDPAGPLVTPQYTSVFGFRDDDQVAKHGGGDPRAAGIHCQSLQDILIAGFGTSSANALQRVLSSGKPFWIHLDLDVLDDAVMPANDHRLADGLSIGEVVAIVRRAIATGQAAGINVTIFNPDLDWDGSVARRITDMLAAALAPAAALRKAGNQ